MGKRRGEEEEEEEEAELLFSLMGGFYGPLFLAVTCSILFLAEEYSTWSTLGVDFWWDSLFSAYWFDSGYMVLPVFGGFCV